MVVGPSRAWAKADGAVFSSGDMFSVVGEDACCVDCVATFSGGGSGFGSLSCWPKRSAALVSAGLFPKADPRGLTFSFNAGEVRDSLSTC